MSVLRIKTSFVLNTSPAAGFDGRTTVTAAAEGFGNGRIPKNRSALIISQKKRIKKRPLHHATVSPDTTAL
ncbi:hypothetical protein BHK98_11975 [Hornefia porci]|uniref:Uncharacterized protein n=1 Tax=Hornefia porci TaxID=2652292 RepID=A0A1Q9JKH5_9FIRM|nr:hypothetical protein BHK98_11975 [Hornefia porci]